MVFHVFNINTYPLNLRIIKSIEKVSKEDKSIENHYILYGNCGDTILNKYQILFETLKVKKYFYSKNIWSLFKFIFKYRNAVFIAHGMTYECLAVLTTVSSNVNWICWGAGAQINKHNIKSRLFTPVKKIIYARMKTINVLMTGDKKTLERDFHLKNIEILPYYDSEADEIKQWCESQIKNNLDKENKTRVLLGNSANNIRYYFELLDRLQKFKGKIKVNCMIQYPVVDRYIVSKLLNKGRDLFGLDFALDTEVMEYANYLKYINSYDIYICGNKTQSGLGAISTCLRLGKKIYIAGKNLQWIQSLGYVVYDAEQLDIESDNSFLNDLPQERKEINFNLSYKLINEVKNQWLEYLLKLNNPHNE